VVFHLENKNMNIGKRIKELRLANQLTQDELAVRSDLSAAFISMLERNKSSVSIEYLTKVLTVLGESLSDFFSSDSKRKQFAKAGCCFQYKADQEHSFENVGKSAAEILLITWPPQF
jgi:transcriptional regulator with XRE-family HTH domain